MKSVVNDIYNEIIKPKEYDDDLLLRTSSIRIFLLIIFKIINIVRLHFIGIIKTNPNVKEKDVAIVLTNNQMRSISPLKSDSFAILRPYLDSSLINNTEVFYFTPLRYILDLFFHVRYFLGRSEVSLKQLYNAFAYFYYYSSFKCFFLDQKPKSVIISNPSHPILRCAVIAARELGICTVYIPHASPSPLYPKIVTDYALLEGEDALTYYSFADYTKTVLLGSPRLDAYQKVKPIPHSGINVLIATNLLDDMEKVKELIIRLQLEVPSSFSFILRPHPNQNISEAFYKDLPKLTCSNSKKETCLQALQRSDILIAGNTTTFFEAIYFPITCYYYDFVKDCNSKDSYNLHSYQFIKILTPQSELSYDFTVKDREKDLLRVDYAFVNNINSTVAIKEILSQIHNNNEDSCING